MFTVGQVLITIVGIVLIMLILIQRGRGQGLAGAFGGMGGSTLLGTKAGTFIGKLTGWLLAAFVVLALLMNMYVNFSGARTPSEAPPARGTP